MVYYSHLKKLWDKFQNYKQVTPYTSGTNLVIDNQREKRKVYQFLFEFDNSIYSTVRFDIIQKELAPKVN